ncbi:hypothetical protein F4778DRAFT_61393 [Xylariomycetidae sp. FL2044]|nr:hypothetical protein F4778DRAFT_61393 [Xylariomycetidae sp. FL2044]
MTSPLPQIQPSSSKVPVVDLSSFSTDATADRLDAARILVQTLRQYGFVQISGHGLSRLEVQEALGWAKKLFDLPTEEKMKAPHPPSNTHHRGYSGISQEKVYTQADLEAQGSGDLRKISDYKESYEVGSEQDAAQPNIWLPEDVLPDFRSSMNALYARLAGVSGVILGAIGAGLDLEAEEHAALMQLISNQHCQLRLLHYPPISREKLETQLLTRLPAHTDWGTFTILFQDQHGGLELKDPHEGQFLLAEPQEDTLVLNIGDMLERFTNGLFTSAVHRVSVPDAAAVASSGIPARYSVPFFVMPGSTQTVAPLPRFVTPDCPAKYDPVVFDEYGLMLTKYQYQKMRGTDGVAK